MTRMPTAPRVDPRLDPVFVERERNRFAARALAFLILLNGAAAIVLLSILARAPESSVEPKFASAMLFFSGGAVAALFSSFLAYVNRTVTMEAPERASLRRASQCPQRTSGGGVSRFSTMPATWMALDSSAPIASSVSATAIGSGSVTHDRRDRSGKSPLSW